MTDSTLSSSGTFFRKMLLTPAMAEDSWRSYQPPSPKGEGAEVSKMAIRVWAGGYAYGGGGSAVASVRLSVPG